MILRDKLAELRTKGTTPRLVIDARRRDVSGIPERFRKDHALVLDLDPSYPMDLVVDDEGVFADLAFGGSVHRCGIPWASILAVVDQQAANVGVMRAGWSPADPPELDAALFWRPPGRRPLLRSIKGGKA